MFDLHKKIISKNENIFHPVLKDKNIHLFLKREDLLDPYVSGNKFRKLKHNISAAKEAKKTTILTFGGAFSNHILATAVAARNYNLKAIGVIRGDELGTDLAHTLSQNTTLEKAHAYGMIFEFVSREDFRRKDEIDFINKMKEKYGDFYQIPEGGTNILAVKGCEEILTDDDAVFDTICCAVGTGGTISGLINATHKHQKVIGFPALKGDFLIDEIKKYTFKSNWCLQQNYHFGGYAKSNDVLIQFMNSFFTDTKILLDPIYTGKMMFGIIDLVKKNYFKPNSSILAIHTGGLQGITGFNAKLKNKNKDLIKVS